MEIKSARKAARFAVPALLLALGTAACGGGDHNANNANASNRNAAATNTAASNTAVVTTPTPAASSEDTALKNEVQANLTKHGVTGVTVETANGEVTLKGNVARAKLADAMKAANDAKPKKVNNQLNIQ